MSYVRRGQQYAVVITREVDGERGPYTATEFHGPFDTLVEVNEVIETAKERSSEWCLFTSATIMEVNILHTLLHI